MSDGNSPFVLSKIFPKFLQILRRTTRYFSVGMSPSNPTFTLNDFFGWESFFHFSFNIAFCDFKIVKLNSKRAPEMSIIFESHWLYVMWTILHGPQNIEKIFEIGPTAFESLLIRSFLNSSFELVLYGSISTGSLLIGFALTFGFTEREVLDFRSRFLEPEVVFVSEDRLGLSRDDFLSCTFGEFLQIYFIAYNIGVFKTRPSQISQIQPH